MPKPSTPALLPTIVSPFTPLSCKAAIRFSGMPQRPKPPAAMVILSCSRPSRAAAWRRDKLCSSSRRSLADHRNCQLWDAGLQSLQRMDSARCHGSWRLRREGASIFMTELLAHQLAQLRLFPEFRRSFQERRARSETARDRLVWLRARRLERGALRDRAESRLGFFGEEWRDRYRNRAQGAAGLGRVRERLLHSLFRLQRHLSLEGTGASER